MAATSRRPRVRGWVEVVSGQHAGVVFQRSSDYDDTYVSGQFCLSWLELLDYAGTDGVRPYKPKSATSRRPRVGGWVEVVSGQHAGVTFQRSPDYDDLYVSGHFALSWSELLDYAGADGVQPCRAN